VSGDVELTDVDTDDVTGTIVSGELTVRNLKAKTAEFSSVSGDVQFDGATCDRVTVKSVSGAISYSGRFATNGRYELQTHSGNVTVSPIGSPAFDLDAATFKGEVRSDFPLSGERSARREPHVLRGSVGQGGAILSIRTFNGDVIVARK
jgi:DUF4097 and DUF4098 domain-containing protein YvlB